MFLIDTEALIDQYIGDVSDYQTGQYLVIKSLTCPTFADHISKCEYTTSCSGCYSHGGEAVLTCINSKSTMCVCVSVCVSVCVFVSVKMCLLETECMWIYVIVYCVYRLYWKSEYNIWLMCMLEYDAHMSTFSDTHCINISVWWVCNVCVYKYVCVILN